MENILRFAGAFAAVAAGLFAVPCVAETLYTMDFADKAKFTKVASLRNVTVSPDGRSLRSTGYTVSFSLGDLPDLKREFKMSMTVKEFARNVAGKDAHWGFNGFDADGNRAQFLTRGGDSGFSMQLTSAKGNRICRDSKGMNAVPTVGRGPDAKPYRVELTVGWRGYSISIDGALVLSGSYPLMPLRGLSLYTYNVDLELSDLKIEDVPPHVFEPIEEPLLEASFLAGVPAAKKQEILPLAHNLSGEAGGIMFWYRRGADDRVCEFLDATNRPVLNVLVNDFTWFVVRTASGKTIDYRRQTMFGKASNDWSHIAFTWRPDGKARLFVNGIPYKMGFHYGERAHWLMYGNILDTAEKVRFGAGSKGRNGPVVEDFKVFRREVANHEVMDAYRARMPFDCVFENSVVPVGTPTPVTVKIAPGGYYTRPNPVESATNICGTADFELSIDGGAPTVRKGVRVDRVMDLSTEPTVFAEPGNHTLRITVNGRYSRAMSFSSAKPCTTADVTPSDERWQKGELLLEKAFRTPADMPWREGVPTAVRSPIGDYLECGAAGANRMSCELFVEPKWIGKPLLLEIDWPDDKARSMAFYLYPPMKGNGQSQRDRLQAGIQAGEEYPNTGKMQTQQYLVFFPATNYLFEARTMVGTWPAALSAIRLYALKEPLPVLKVRPPAGYPARKLGHADEDQTFYNNLNADHVGWTTPAIVPELVRYCKYTGQNAFFYPIVRYFCQYGPVEGSPGNGMFPFRQGELGYAITELAKNGIAFDAQCAMGGLPDAQWFDLRETPMDEIGALAYDCDGRSPYIYNVGNQQANPIHPFARRMFFHYIGDIIRNNATNGLSSLNYPLDNAFGSYRSLKIGYEDWTVGKFSRETGIALPASCAKAAGKSRYGARYDFLTATNTPAVRAAWLKWRSEQVTDFARELVAFMKAADPKMNLTINVGSVGRAAGLTPGEDSAAYVEHGVDYAAIAQIPGVGFTCFRDPTTSRWQMFRGNEMPRLNEKLYDIDDPFLKGLRAVKGSVAATIANNIYFETFCNSLTGKPYGSYFQDSDVKAWGRYFLKDLAYALAQGDTLAQYTGMQPLGSFGSEDVIREWAKAYCALPAVPFTDIPGPGDPAVARFLETKEGTYVYVVNLHHTPFTASLGVSTAATDLSTGLSADLSKIALRPFELRSFLIPAATDGTEPVPPPGGPTSVSAAFRLSVSGLDRACYDARLADLDRAVGLFEKNGMDHTVESKIIADARTAIAEGRLGEAHRLLFTKDLCDMMAKLKDFDNVVAEAKLRQAGIVRVNCGSTHYATLEGDLFFPDKTDDGRTYGHVGPQFQCCNRSVVDMKPAKYAKLYETEGYFLTGYNFHQLPKGNYRVTMYLKCGWKNDWKGGWWLMDIWANGKKVADPIDLFDMQKGDFNQPAPFTFDATVGDDGELKIDFKLPKGYKGYGASVLFMNGISVERK